MPQALQPAMEQIEECSWQEHHGPQALEALPRCSTLRVLVPDQLCGRLPIIPKGGMNHSR